MGTARSLVPLMDVSDRVTRLECSSPRERRYATKARSPVPRSLPLRPGGVYAKPLVPRSSLEVSSPHRRGAYRARDGPRPSAEGARHCPSGHGGKGEATLLL